MRIAVAKLGQWRSAKSGFRPALKTDSVVVVVVVMLNQFVRVITMAWGLLASPCI